MDAMKPRCRVGDLQRKHRRHTAKPRGCLDLEGPTVRFVGFFAAQRQPTCGRLKQSIERVRKYYRKVLLGPVIVPSILTSVSSLSIVHYISVQVRCPKGGENLFSWSTICSRRIEMTADLKHRIKVLSNEVIRNYQGSSRDYGCPSNAKFGA